ncbi:MAG: tetratricopeptide repeat protein [Bacteroidales bacterium]
MKIKMLQNLLLIAGLAVIGLQVQGQTFQDAVNAYNSGLDLIESDISAAIASIEKSYEIASALGEEGEEVKIQAENQIPGLYYQKGVNLYRERNIDQAIVAFVEAVEVSEKFNDANSKTRSETLLHQLYAIQANSVFRENNNDKALELYDKALAINPQHARSHLGKALVYRRLEDTDSFKESVDMAIETGLTTNEEQIIQTAESTARDYFLVRSVKAKSENNLTQAAEMINHSFSYDQSFAESYFLLASIQNEQSRFQDAVKNSQKALELLNGSREETAKVHFELAKAYEGLGNTSQACASYKNASFGQYEASAQYQIEHVLKCQ